MCHNLPRARRGTAAILALVFLVLMGVIASSTFYSTSVNSRIGYNIQAMDHAVSNAETGIRWITDRFKKMNRPTTYEGKITATVAQRIWGSPSTPNSIIRAIVDDLKLRSRSAETQYSFANGVLMTAEIWLDDTGRNRFQLSIFQDPNDPRVLRVVSTGMYGKDGQALSAARSVKMDYLITKILPYAAMGNNQVQIGANTVIEGDVAMRTVLSDKRSPVLCVSDFNHMSSVRNEIIRFRNLAKFKAESGNRVRIDDRNLWQECVNAGFSDLNGDNFIDEYDVFLKVYDTKQLASDRAGATVTWDQEFNEDWEWFNIVNHLGSTLDPSKPQRAGFGPDDKNVDNLDRYAKIRGQLLIGEDLTRMLDRLRSANLNFADVVQGPIAPNNPADEPVKFGMKDEIVALTPADFAEACYRLRDMVLNDLNDTKPVTSPVISNRTITPDMAVYGTPRLTDPEEVVKVVDPKGLNGKTASEGNEIGSIKIAAGTYIKKKVIDQLNQSLPTNQRATYQQPGPHTIIERFPYGATSVQATFKRPVFRNMTFEKCRIPKGLNALFVECTFKDVTFIDTDETVGGATDENQGNSWAVSGASSTFTKAKPLVGASFNPASDECKTNGSKLGNNLRFESCTFEGPLVGTPAKAYTHHANSWEFNGTSPGTLFDNKWLDPSTGSTTATIISPQVNIEMGSFGPQEVQSILTGVVVGGNVDIRGKCIVDGCLISLRSGSGTMTLGYFGPGDDDNDPDAMPEGGFGAILIRSNPLRTLPDGINIPISILPAIETYQNLD